MSAELRQRSDLLGTQVITRTTGKRLGVVSQLWVDIDSQAVVALSLRPNLFYGTPQPMRLDSIRQIGDVILVEDDTAIEDLDVERYNTLINCEVITETGEVLGKVRGFKFDIDSGQLATLVIASLGLPLIPDRVLSTYELSINEIVSSGPDRLIVYEGTEERLTQITVGLLEQVGIGGAPWEKDDAYPSMTPTRVENQLPSGSRQPMQAPVQRRPMVDTRSDNRVQAREEIWDEDEREPVELRQSQSRPAAAARYLEQDDDDEDDNWGTASSGRSGASKPVGQAVDYQDVDYAEVVDEAPAASPAPFSAPAPNPAPIATPSPAPSPAPNPVMATPLPPIGLEAADPLDDEADAWASPPASTERPLTPLNIPQPVKEKAPEYEDS
jgi:sporulation protein YlmC with PRC-barrel domain